MNDVRFRNGADEFLGNLLPVAPVVVGEGFHDNQGAVAPGGERQTHHLHVYLRCDVHNYFRIRGEGNEMLFLLSVFVFFLPQCIIRLPAVLRCDKTIFS